MTIVRRGFEGKPRAPSLVPGTADGNATQQNQQCLLNVARSQPSHEQQLTEARVAIARSQTLLAKGARPDHAAATGARLTNVRAQVPCPPRCQHEAAEAEPGDLGRDIATAILRLLPDVIDEHGLIFELADPEPVLRGIASAYAAIAHALPGGRDEAWTLWGLLALELEAGNHQPATS